MPIGFVQVLHQPCNRLHTLPSRPDHQHTRGHLPVIMQRGIAWSHGAGNKLYHAYSCAMSARHIRPTWSNLHQMSLWFDNTADSQQGTCQLFGATRCAALLREHSLCCRSACEPRQRELYACVLGFLGRKPARSTSMHCADGAAWLAALTNNPLLPHHGWYDGGMLNAPLVNVRP
jgi:hypothetical protein